MRILSPVYFKELGQIAVSRKPLVMKLVLIGVLLADFALVLVSQKSGWELDSGEVGQGLFVSLAVIELIAMIVFTPIVTAGMVCGEKESNTLGLLFLTRLKSWNIVQDKGLSRITFMVFICAVTVPFMFAALLFGGVETGQIVAATGNILAVIFLCGGISLLCSTLLQKFGAALAVSYSGIFLYMVVLPILVTMVLESLKELGFSPVESELFVTAINPFVSMFQCMDPYGFRGGGRWLGWTWACNLAIGLVVYMSAVALSAALLRRVAFREPASDSKRKRGFLKKLWHSPLPIHPASLLQRRGDAGSRPVFWKESNLIYDNLKTPLYRVADVLFSIYVAVIAACLVGVAIKGRGYGWLDDEELHMFGHALGFIIVALFAAILAAVSFAREREAGTFDILLTTRLKAGEMVFGTFFGVVRSIIPFVVPLVLIVVIGRAFCHKMRLEIPLLNIAVYLGFVVALGLFMSVRCRTTGRAIGWTLAILLLLCAGIPILGGMGEATDLWDFEDVLGFSPVYWVVAGPGKEPYDSHFGGMTGYAGVTAAYALASLFLLVRLAVCFDKIVGRRK